MRERVRRRRVGEVVGGHVDRLHRRDRAGARRRDALLQLPHLGRERRLVADGARHAAEERRHLGARLHEAEDVVDEEQHVLALVAEVLRHRQAGQADAQARARRLVHLAVDDRDLVEHARLRPSRGSRSLPSRVRSPTPVKTETPPCCCATLWISSWISHRLADAGAAEEADLAAAHVRRDQVDDLDARLEDLDLRRQLAERRRVAVDRPALARRRLLAVDRVADHVPDAPERLVADRHRDRLARVDDLGAARETVGRVHRDRADAIVAEMLLHLRDQLAVAVRAWMLSAL